MFSGIVIPIICSLLISTLAPDVLHVGEEGCMDLIRLGIESYTVRKITQKKQINTYVTVSVSVAAHLIIDTGYRPYR